MKYGGILGIALGIILISTTSGQMVFVGVGIGIIAASTLGIIATWKLEKIEQRKK